jgi:hypothetical protein
MEVAMRCVLMGACLLVGGQAAAAPERPAWVRHDPIIHLAEAMAMGAALNQVAMMPRNPLDRLQARAGMEFIPVYYLTLQGRLLRCSDRPDPDSEQGRIIPAPCDVAVPRSGAPWIPRAP